MRRFHKDFHEWGSHKWKSLPNRVTSDKTRYWREPIYHFKLMHTILCPEHANLLTTIIERSFRHWTVFSEHCDVTIVDCSRANWTLNWNFNQNIDIFLHGNELGNSIFKKAVVVSRLQELGKTTYANTLYLVAIMITFLWSKQSFTYLNTSLFVHASWYEDMCARSRYHGQDK